MFLVLLFDPTIFCLLWGTLTLCNCLLTNKGDTRASSFMFTLYFDAFIGWVWKICFVCHLRAEPLKTMSKPGLSSAPSTQTACSTALTLTVPSYTQGSAGCCIPTPCVEGEILSFPHLKAFSFNELKSAMRNFHPDSLNWGRRIWLCL